MDRRNGQLWRPGQFRIGGDERSFQVLGDDDVERVGDGEVVAFRPGLGEDRSDLNPIDRGQGKRVDRDGSSRRLQASAQFEVTDRPGDFCEVVLWRPPFRVRWDVGQECSSRSGGEK